MPHSVYIYIYIFLPGFTWEGNKNFPDLTRTLPVAVSSPVLLLHAAARSMLECSIRKHNPLFLFPCLEIEQVFDLPHFSPVFHLQVKFLGRRLGVLFCMHLISIFSPALT